MLCHILLFTSCHNKYRLDTRAQTIQEMAVGMHHIIEFVLEDKWSGIKRQFIYTQMSMLDQIQAFELPN
jgi:hypothetical protein